MSVGEPYAYNLVLISIDTLRADHLAASAARGYDAFFATISAKQAPAQQEVSSPSYLSAQAAADAPELHRIQNPAARFRVGEDIFATGFLIHEETWRERAKA